MHKRHTETLLCPIPWPTFAREFQNPSSDRTHAQHLGADRAAAFVLVRRRGPAGRSCCGTYVDLGAAAVAP